MEETIVLKKDVIMNENTAIILNDVVNILNEKGYNAVDQIVGYLISGDPGYITSYKNARNMISSIDRNKILEILLINYIKRK